MATKTTKKKGGKGGKGGSWRHTASAMDFSFGANVKVKGGKRKPPPGGGSV